MFKPRLKPSEQGTLERRYEFHVGEAVRAALLGDYEKAAGHSRTALEISRELYGGSRDQAAQRPGLAAALAGNARYQRVLDSVVMLTQAAGHYAALAEADPGQYEAERLDVLVTVAVTADAAGSTPDAIRLLREVIRMYRAAPAAKPAARDAGLAKACFHLGRCLLKAGAPADGLASIDAGLAAAESARRGLPAAGRRAGRPGAGRAGGATCARDDEQRPGWLSGAPRPVQTLAPDWVAAATCSMTLHAAAGQWPAATTAAYAAVRVSGGLAELSGDAGLAAHAMILAQARDVWARARQNGAGGAPLAAGHASEPATTAARG